MRLFALVGALIVAGGVYLAIDGGVQLNRCITLGTLYLEVWRPEFWLRIPDQPGMGLGANAHWFIRLVGGVLAVYLGGRLIKFVTD